MQELLQSGDCSTNRIQGYRFKLGYTSEQGPVRFLWSMLSEVYWAWKREERWKKKSMRVLKQSWMDWKSGNEGLTICLLCIWREIKPGLLTAWDSMLKTSLLMLWACLVTWYVVSASEGGPDARFLHSEDQDGSHHKAEGDVNIVIQVLDLTPQAYSGALMIWHCQLTRRVRESSRFNPLSPQPWPLKQ